MIRYVVAVVVGCSFAGATVLAEDPKGLVLKTRPTYGLFGPPRSTPLIVGEKVMFSNTISGLSPDREGYVNFSVKVEIRKANGEVQETNSYDRKKDWESGMHSFPTFVSTPDVNPGPYVHICTITDNANGQKVTTETQFQVAEPKGVAIHQLQLGMGDVNNQFRAGGGTCVVGDKMVVEGLIANFATADFKMNCSITTTVLDINGTPVKWRSRDTAIIFDNEWSRYDSHMRQKFGIYVNAVRPGKYILRVHLQDVIGKTEVTEYLPFQILDPPDWSMPKGAQKKQNSDKKVNR